MENNQYRLLNNAWLKAFGDFIISNHNYAIGKDSEFCGGLSSYADVQRILHDMSVRLNSSGYDYVSDDRWMLEVKVLAFFLNLTPIEKDSFRVISWTPWANISRYSNYDPLTYQGLCDIDNFIHNGLCDDWMLACYTGTDGDKRIIDEQLDSAIRWNTEPITAKLIGDLDKDEAWLRSAKRTNLDLDSFNSLFMSHITEENLAVPTQDELMSLWMARSYTDFTGTPAIMND